MKTKVYLSRVTLRDQSSFWRGECNDCDWIHEELFNLRIYSYAQVHLKVFHNGGIICHPGFEIEVKGNE